MHRPPSPIKTWMAVLHREQTAKHSKNMESMKSAETTPSLSPPNTLPKKIKQQQHISKNNKKQKQTKTSNFQVEFNSSHVFLFLIIDSLLYSSIKVVQIKRVTSGCAHANGSRDNTGQLRVCAKCVCVGFENHTHTKNHTLLTVQSNYFPLTLLLLQWKWYNCLISQDLLMDF